MGSLHIVLGPMFSGKTTRLIQIYHAQTCISKKVAVINYAGDIRYDPKMLLTHDQISIPCIQLTALDGFDCSSYDTILINEAQFFGDLFEIVIQFVENCDKEVHIFGLDGDFLRNKFGGIVDLIPYCDSVEKLSALCAYCCDGTKALFSFRMSREVEQMVIGADNYKPLCRKCCLNYNV